MRTPADLLGSAAAGGDRAPQQGRHRPEDPQVPRYGRAICNLTGRLFGRFDVNVNFAARLLLWSSSRLF